jgi:hypothetical protein
LADARLFGEVAAVGADPAYPCAKRPLRLSRNVEARLEQQIEAGNRVSGEGYAVSIGGAIAELND